MLSKALGTLTSGIALSLMTQTASSDEIIKGINAYAAKQYEQAFSIFSNHANIANPVAMYYLSTLYLSGNGVKQDEYLAFQYCEQAAKEGLVEAQFELGMMYLNGIGVMNEDEDMALEWLWKAADSGHQPAKEMFDFILNRDLSLGC
jgi:TPR repeat protein